MTEPHGEYPHDSSRRVRALWLLVAVGVAAIAVREGFSLTRIFYLRDLSFYAWPEHLWLRRTILAGEWPLWDPYVGFGQSAVADPVRHIFFLPAQLLRFAFPETLGFNLILVVPFLVSAAGTFLFLARRATPPAAALGAIVFAVSGPSLSTGNFTNWAWAAALVPWALLCVERLVERPTAARFAAAACAFSLQFLAGEGVTLVATAALAVAYAAVCAEGPTAARVRAMAWTMGGGLTGLLLSSVVALPMIAALHGSFRGSGPDARVTNAWSLHPLTLLETVAPSLFTDPVDFGGGYWPWLSALNGSMAPFVYSTYLGIGALALAVVALAARPRARVELFWLAVFALSIVAALGPHTPIYPSLQAALPQLGSLRFPSKYVLFAAFALAPLAARGFDTIAVARHDASRRRSSVGVGVTGTCIVGVVALVVSAGSFAATGAVARLSTALAGSVGIDAATEAGGVLLESLRTAAPRLAALSALVALLVWIAGSRHRRARVAHVAIVAVIAFDLLVAGAGLMPTVDASLLGQPPWVDVVRAHPHARIYIAGRAGSAVGHMIDRDDPQAAHPAPRTELPVRAESATHSVFLATFPSAWQVRDSLSFDNTFLWPREYEMVLRRFRGATREERLNFLARSGVRYLLVPWQELSGAEPRAEYDSPLHLTLYELEESPPRAEIVYHTDVAGLDEQIERLFAGDGERTLVEKAPTGSTAATDATVDEAVEVVVDRPGEIVLRASVAEGGGHLVLRDAFSSEWRATVDGHPVEIARADALFRSVAVPSGEHTIRLIHVPKMFYIGLVLSLLTSTALAAAVIASNRRNASCKAMDGQPAVRSVQIPL